MDTEFLKSFLYLGSVGVIVGCVQIFKPIITNNKWYGVMSVGFGIGINFLITLALTGITVGSVVTAILYGLVAGLAASGAYSTGSTIRGGS